MTLMGRIAVAPDRSGLAPARPSAAPGAGDVRALVHPAASAIDTLAPDWSRLAAEAAEPNAFSEHWFVAASLPTMGKGRGIRLIEVRRGKRLIGLLPVAVTTGYARLPVRLVRNWLHDQAFLGTPLVAAGEEEAFWRAVLETLDAASWAPSLLHLTGLAENGPVHRGLAAVRGAGTVYREQRALLESGLDPDAYYEAAVRQKKRKEIRRLRSRLAELGTLSARALENPLALDEYCDAFLALEKAGWKGEAGSALACDWASELFFRDAVRGAFEAGRLQFLRLDLDGRAIAMLVNFMTPPGSFSFKTVFDEDYARFSPGVLIQLENLKILNDPTVDWMDSCAAEDHPMIDSLWQERRAIVRVTVRLKGARRLAAFAFCRALELGSAALKKVRR